MCFSDKWHKSESEALLPQDPSEKTIPSKSNKGNSPNKLNVSSKVKVKRPLTVGNSNRAERTATIVEPVASTSTSMSDVEKMLINQVDANPSSSTPSRSTASVLLQPVVALTPLGSPSRTSNSPPALVKPTHGTVPNAALKQSHMSGITTNLKLGHGTSIKSSPSSASSSLNLSAGAINSSSSFSSPTPTKKRQKVGRKSLPIKEREYDADKHCGVWNGETNKPCTRSLTCKSHTLSMRRAVIGRSKNFDLLLAEHKAAKETIAKSAKPTPARPPTQVYYFCNIILYI